MSGENGPVDGAVAGQPEVSAPAGHRGRPAKFQDAESQRKIGLLLGIYGLTGTQAVMASFGIGNGPESVSLPTLSKVAEGQGITFARGRKAAA